MFKVGDKIRVKECHYTNSSFWLAEGEIVQVLSENDVMVLIRKKQETPFRFYSNVNERLELISSTTPTASIKEKPCSNQFCQKMNDVGTAHCWWCAAKLNA